MRFRVDAPLGAPAAGPAQIDVALDVALETVIVAGYTGADRDAVLHHIHELEEIGIPPPPMVPMYWRFPPWLAMATERVEVVGAQTSGEAELVLVADGDDLYITVGSDHTDRAAEAVDIAMSKGICPRVIGSAVWPAGTIGGRWGELILRSWIVEKPGDPEVLYQEGACSSLVPPLTLLAGIPFPRPHRFAMLTGTVPVIGGVRPAVHFRAELRDPTTNRSIGLSYSVHSLDATAPSTLGTGTV